MLVRHFIFAAQNGTGAARPWRRRGISTSRCGNPARTESSIRPTGCERRLRERIFRGRTSPHRYGSPAVAAVGEKFLITSQLFVPPPRVYMDGRTGELAKRPTIRTI